MKIRKLITILLAAVVMYGSVRDPTMDAAGRIAHRSSPEPSTDPTVETVPQESGLPAATEASGDSADTGGTCFRFYLEGATVTAVADDTLPEGWTQSGNDFYAPTFREKGDATARGVLFPVSPLEGYLITSAYFLNHIQKTGGGIISQNGTVTFGYHMNGSTYGDQRVDHYVTAYQPKLGVSIRQRSADQEVFVGDTVELTVTVTPDQDPRLDGFTQTLEVVSVTIGGREYEVHVTYDGGVWTGMLAYTVLEEDIQGASVTAEAAASVAYSGTVEVQNNGAPVGSFSTNATVTTTAETEFQISAAALDVTESVRPATPQAGGEVTYTITVTNRGQLPLYDVRVTDSMEEDVALSEAEWTIERLEAGQSRTFTAAFSVTEEILRAFGGRSLMNTATAAGHTPLGRVLTDTAEAAVTIPQAKAELTLTKTADPAAAQTGDTITYTIFVQNTGNVTVEDVTVEDPMTGIAHSVGSLGPKETAGPITTMYQVTAEDVLAGKIENTAAASGTYGEETVTAVGSASVTVEKKLLTITIVGFHSQYGYTGAPQEVAGYDVKTELPEGVSVALAEGKRAVAERTDVGATYMKLTRDDFIVSGAEAYRVTIDYTDGYVEILPKHLESQAGGMVPSTVYNGEPQPRKPTVLDGEKILAEGRDYTLRYSADTTNAGTVTVTVTGIGNYTGAFELTYDILPRAAVIVIADQTKVQGEEDPAFSAEIDGLLEGDSLTYRLTREEGEEPGVYWIYAEPVPGGELALGPDGTYPLAEEGNYTVTVHPGKLTITPPDTPVTPPTLPGLPEIPGDPNPPQPPDIPDLPDVPGTPDTPDAPDVPDTPDITDPPDVPGTTAPPDVPDTPDTTAPTEVPDTTAPQDPTDDQDVPKGPTVPTAPGGPGAPDGPDGPEIGGEAPPPAEEPAPGEDCCILHLLLLLLAFAAAAYYAHDEKRRQAKEFALRRELLRSAFGKMERSL